MPKSVYRLSQLTHLNCSIREYTLLLPCLGENALHGAVRETNFLGPVGEMLLHLFACKPEHLQAVVESCLCCLRLIEIVDCLLRWRKTLFDVAVGEVNHSVTVRPSLFLYSVVKQNLSVTIWIEHLAFTITSSGTLYLVIFNIVVVWLGQPQLKVFLPTIISFIIFNERWTSQ